MPGSDTLSPEQLQSRVKEEITRHGVDAARRKFGVSRESLMRIAAGLDVRAGTLLLVQQNAMRLDLIGANAGLPQG